jgi:signal transduction histidine kinase
MNAPDVEHALRNHLAIILGYTELLLQDTADDDPRREDIQEILKATRAALALVAGRDAHQ